MGCGACAFIDGDHGEGKLMESFIVPGALVRHPEETAWGVGQVQSVVGSRITVNFENAGKRLINGELIQLVLVSPERDD
jgi:hypothetical protein